MAVGLIPLKSLLIGALETAVNRYLLLDPQAEHWLRPLSGKVIAVHIKPTAESIYLCPGVDGIQILVDYQGPVDASLTGSLAALGLMGFSNTPMRSLLKGEVQMQGDLQVARRLQNLFEKLEVNPEAKLAEYTGSAFARAFSDFLRSGQNWGRQSLNSLRLNIQEFLQEESRELPARPEAEILFGQIDDCRHHYDRLNARYQRLLAALSANPESKNPPGSSS